MPVILDIVAVDKYSRELQDTRVEINKINQRIAQQRRVLLTANDAQREALQGLIKRNTAEKAVLVSQAQSLSLEKNLLGKNYAWQNSKHGRRKKLQRIPHALQNSKHGRRKGCPRPRTHETSDTKHNPGGTESAGGISTFNTSVRIATRCFSYIRR